jgi:hypothetical protein
MKCIRAGAVSVALFGVMAAGIAAPPSSLPAFGASGTITLVAHEAANASPLGEEITAVGSWYGVDTNRDGFISTSEATFSGWGVPDNGGVSSGQIRYDIKNDELILFSYSQTFIQCPETSCWANAWWGLGWTEGGEGFISYTPGHNASWGWQAETVTINTTRFHLNNGHNHVSAATQVPEPSTYALMLVGLAAFAIVSMRKMRRPD